MEIRTQDEFALETACLAATACVGDLVEGNPLGDARPDRVCGEQSESAWRWLVSNQSGFQSR
jgi:hypothetical protein